MDLEFEKEWREAIAPLEAQFGGDLEMDAILFLIGIQELGKGMQPFSKDQKLDVIHIAVCTLLEPYGYYEYVGDDKDGWPHFDRTQKLPHLKGKDQERLMKEAVINYIRTQQLFS
ncbi:MAG: hypothetical protein CL843_17140 [Crocinitomicaceae bacterium]|nr:hypothetical protein [Crocinitomicaceae bacterium]|tara:strand:+ start:762 stop:1106 length:345 start_codon:yes stop_codon:yes gene_type:complete